MEKLELYREFLDREGYRPQVDKDGDILFKFEGGNYLLFVNKDDPEFFQLVFPGFWEIDDGEELARALVAASHANSKCKAVKVVVSPKRNVSAMVEMFFERPDQFAPVFARSIGAIRFGVKTFADKMRGEE